MFIGTINIFALIPRAAQLFPKLFVAYCIKHFAEVNEANVQWFPSTEIDAFTIELEVYCSSAPMEAKLALINEVVHFSQVCNPVTENRCS